MNEISKVQSWILAARPKTLTAAIVPVMVGSALAWYDRCFNITAALVALFCSLLIQIGTNFVNDLYDFLKGTDKKDRSGPARALVNGYISILEMKIAVYLVFGLSFLAGLYLVSLGGMPILIIGIFSILAGLAYTAGPFPLAYNGLGDIFVFLFFGLVATVGTYYVQALRITNFAFLASVPVGALITNILIVNNYRDTDEDKISGKKTTAVLFGKKFARLQYVFLMVVSYIMPVIIFFTIKPEPIIFLPMLTLPIAVKAIKMLYQLEGARLNSTLELTAKLTAIYGFLFALGIL